MFIFMEVCLVADAVVTGEDNSETSQSYDKLKLVIFFGRFKLLVLRCKLSVTGRILTSQKVLHFDIQALYSWSFFLLLLLFFLNKK